MFFFSINATVIGSKNVKEAGAAEAQAEAVAGEGEGEVEGGEEDAADDE